MDADVRREIDNLTLGSVQVTGSFNLAVAPATSTVVTRRAMSSGSIVLTQAYSALASNADIVRIVPAKGAFTITHTASANARTHRYVFFTGPDTP